MISAPRFLLVDDDRADRGRLTQALHAEFPDAVVDACDTGAEAFAFVRERKFTAIIAHRARDTAALPLVWQFRDLDGRVPLILVSDTYRREAARAAGANDFLRCAECNRVGAVIAGVLAAAPADAMHHQWA